MFYIIFWVFAKVVEPIEMMFGNSYVEYNFGSDGIH